MFMTRDMLRTMTQENLTCPSRPTREQNFLKPLLASVESSFIVYTNELLNFSRQHVGKSLILNDKNCLFPAVTCCPSLFVSDTPMFLKPPPVDNMVTRVCYSSMRPLTGSQFVRAKFVHRPSVLTGETWYMAVNAFKKQNAQARGRNFVQREDCVWHIRVRLQKM